MKNILIVVLVAIGIVVVLFALKNLFPAIYNDLLLWVAGFMGFVVGGFKKLFGLANTDSIHSMEKENDDIKKRQKELDEAYLANKKLMDQEREVHAREVKALEEQIRLKEMQLQQTLDRIEKLKNKSDLESGKELTEEELDSILGKGTVVNN